jgi:EAL domain-containing protein (putative c-di-GMP-specific phosphodiesterase class I)
MTCALREKQKLAEAGYENVGVAFNASPELLVHSDFFDRLVWEADNANIDHAQITIEVLETTDFGNLAEGSPQASSIRQLYDAGFQIHLDDFGVCFAGLSHLATLNVTGVKLDRSLVGELSVNPMSQKIVRKIIELSNDLSLSVIAEGVEDAGTVLVLQSMGCNVVQGYWLARPMPASALLSWLEVRRRHQSRERAELCL